MKTENNYDGKNKYLESETILRLTQENVFDLPSYRQLKIDGFTKSDINITTKTGEEITSEWKCLRLPEFICRFVKDESEKTRNKGVIWNALIKTGWGLFYHSPMHKNLRAVKKILRTTVKYKNKKISTWRDVIDKLKIELNIVRDKKTHFFVPAVVKVSTQNTFEPILDITESEIYTLYCCLGLYTLKENINEKEEALKIIKAYENEVEIVTKAYTALLPCVVKEIKGVEVEKDPLRITLRTAAVVRKVYGCEGWFDVMRCDVDDLIEHCRLFLEMREDVLREEVRMEVEEEEVFREDVGVKENV